MKFEPQLDTVVIEVSLVKVLRLKVIYGDYTRPNTCHHKIPMVTGFYSGQTSMNQR